MRIYFPILLAMSVSLAPFGCSHDSAREVKKEREIALEQQKLVADIAGRYNADSTWQQDFDSRDVLTQVFTVEIQRKLVTPGGRPIIIVAPIHDIWETSTGEYVLQAEAPIRLASDIHFTLRCPPNTLTAALRTRPQLLDEFVIVAEITAVRKPLLGPTAETSSDETGVSADVELAPSDNVIAVGNCIDIIPLPRRQSNE
jgi:hypothetical protein